MHTRDAAPDIRLYFAIIVDQLCEANGSAGQEEASGGGGGRCVP